jgi:CheY-like chemotaxis protein
MADHAPRVLVVEDDPVSRLVAVRMLQRLGCAVRTAVSGAEAIAWVARERFDLILMDCRLPDIDGLAATRVIRKGPRGGIPIVAVTAGTGSEERAGCLAAGMNDFLDKPISLDALAAAVARWTGAPVCA